MMPRCRGWMSGSSGPTLSATTRSVLRGGEKKIASRIRALLDKAYRRDHLSALDRFAYNDNGTLAHPRRTAAHHRGARHNRRPQGRGPGTARLRGVAAARIPRLQRRYRLVDVARKVVGVGSVGTEAYIILFIGDNVGAPVFLQAKEAGRSVLEPYTEPDLHEHQGQRVVFGQRLMQAASDPFLGWFRGTGPRGLDYYVRQLRDGKASLDINTLFPAGLIRYVEVCGQVLARAHARSGEAPAIAGYLGRGKVFDNAVEEFAIRYADQTIEDHAALVAAVADGRVEAAHAACRPPRSELRLGHHQEGDQADRAGHHVRHVALRSRQRLPPIRSASDSPTGSLNSRRNAGPLDDEGDGKVGGVDDERERQPRLGEQSRPEHEQQRNAARRQPQTNPHAVSRAASRIMPRVKRLGS